MADGVFPVVDPIPDLCSGARTTSIAEIVISLARFVSRERMQRLPLERARMERVMHFDERLLQAREVYFLIPALSHVRQPTHMIRMSVSGSKPVFAFPLLSMNCFSARIVHLWYSPSVSTRALLSRHDPNPRERVELADPFHEISS